MHWIIYKLSEKVNKRMHFIQLTLQRFLLNYSLINNDKYQQQTYSAYFLKLIVSSKVYLFSYFMFI